MITADPASVSESKPYGTAMIDEILQGLESYLGKAKVRATPNSPVLGRIASRTGMNVMAKQKNILAAKTLQVALKTLKNSSTEQDKIFQEALKSLTKVIVQLKQVPEKEQSKDLLPKLEALLGSIEVAYSSEISAIEQSRVITKSEELNQAFETLDIFSKIEPPTADLQKSALDLSRSQHRIFIQGQNLSEYLGKPLPSIGEGKSMASIKESVLTLGERLQGNQAAEGKALIADAMPYLNQNGFLFRAGDIINDELGKINVIGSPSRESELQVTERGLTIVEYYIFDKFMDTSDPMNTKNIVMNKPVVFKHEFEISRNVQGGLEAKTTSLKTAADYTPRVISSPDSPRPGPMSLG